MSRNRLIDIILVIIFYIGVSTFPIGLMTDNPYIFFGVEIALFIVCLLFIFIYGRRQPDFFKPLPKINKKNFLLLLPTVIVVLSNMIYAWILRETFYPSYFYFSDVLVVIHIILVAITEEIIFRHLLISNLTSENKIYKILISAGIFGACHITHFLSTFNPADLIIIVYTFALGLLLGFFYCYGNCLYVCIGVHTLFNICNDFLFVRFYAVNNQLWYYLINAIIALVVGLYLLGIYFIKLRKNPAELG